jgi:hypothetical protein
MILAQKDVDKWRRIVDPEINPHGSYSYPILNKGLKTYIGEKTALLQQVLRKLCIHI